MSKDDPQTRIGAILGLGIAYAGRCATLPCLSLPVSGPTTTVGDADKLPASSVFPAPSSLLCREKEEVAELLLPLVMDTDLSMEVSSIAALSLALIYQGTANGDAVEAILQVGGGVVVGYVLWKSGLCGLFWWCLGVWGRGKGKEEGWGRAAGLRAAHARHGAPPAISPCARCCFCFYPCCPPHPCLRRR